MPLSSDEALERMIHEVFGPSRRRPVIPPDIFYRRVPQEQVEAFYRGLAVERLREQRREQLARKEWARICEALYGEPHM